MTENSEAVRAAQRARRRALIVPREHGAWGLLLVPLLTGVAAGFASAHRAWPLLVFTVATLSLFWLRTPLESLVGTGVVTAHTSGERWTALMASVCLGAVSVACLTGLMWKGRNSELLFLGAATALAFVAQAVLRMFGRRARMAAQLVGTVGLTCTAPAAYYIGAGRLDERAFALWAANWIFAGNQIHFVQLRIRAARAATFSEKFSRGRFFFLAQPAFLVVLTLGPPVTISLGSSTPEIMSERGGINTHEREQGAEVQQSMNAPLRNRFRSRGPIRFCEGHLDSRISYLLRIPVVEP